MYYRNICVGHVRADIILEDLKIVIECKSISNLCESHLPQIINYMEILKYKSGYFVNFNQLPTKDFIEMYKVTCIKENIDRTDERRERERNKLDKK